MPAGICGWRSRCTCVYHKGECDIVGDVFVDAPGIFSLHDDVANIATVGNGRRSAPMPDRASISIRNRTVHHFRAHREHGQCHRVQLAVHPVGYHALHRVYAIRHLASVQKRRAALS